MKKIFVLFILFFSLNCSIAYAKDAVYFKIAGILSSVNDNNIDYQDNIIGNLETETGLGISLALGKQFGNFGFEIEYAHRNADIEKATIGEIDVTDALVTDEISSDVVMFNGIYELSEGGTIKPYILAGIGMNWIEETEGPEFAYQVGGGVSYSLTDNVGAFGEYRYLGSTDATDDVLDELSYSFDSHNFGLGIKYSF